MKKMMVVGLVALTLGLGSPALAHERTVDDTYDDAVMHPLRLAYYAIHPIGFAAQWLVGRPFQYIISREGLRNVFGWQSLDDESSYRSLGGQM